MPKARPHGCPPSTVSFMVSLYASISTARFVCTTYSLVYILQRLIAHIIGSSFCICLALHRRPRVSSLFGWLVADGWCWFVLREEYCWWLVAVIEKYCWLVADKPSEQGVQRAALWCSTTVTHCSVAWASNAGTV
jgi:hypothetical protein